VNSLFKIRHSSFSKLEHELRKIALITRILIAASIRHLEGLGPDTTPCVATFNIRHLALCATEPTARQHSSFITHKSSLP
jgi:hypothetical protein